MNERTRIENEALLAFWDRTLALTEEDRATANEAGPEDYVELAPCEKLIEAARSLGGKKRVLDYGCGNGWAAIIAAKAGCKDVTAADPAAGAAESAGFLAELFGVSDRVHAKAVPVD